MIRAIIVDDHEVVREGLKWTLQVDPRIRVLAAYGDPNLAVRHSMRGPIDVAIVEYRLDGMDGSELCREILQQAPEAAVIVHSFYLAENAVRRCMLAGATAYVAKSAGLGELREALDRVLTPRNEGSRQALIEQQLRGLQATQSRTDMPPTPRQTQILELAAEGLTNLAIAERLFISESTVRFHFNSLREKYEARSKTELIAKAIRCGFIGLPADDGALVG